MVGQEPEGSSVTSIILYNYQADLSVRLAITESNPARMCALFLMDKVFTCPFMFKHCLKLKLVKLAPPKYSSKGEKESKNLQGARRGENRRTLHFPDLYPIFRKTLADCGNNVESPPFI